MVDQTGKNGQDERAPGAGMERVSATGFWTASGNSMLPRKAIKAAQTGVSRRDKRTDAVMEKIEQETATGF